MLKKTLKLITIVALSYNLIGCAHTLQNRPVYPVNPPVIENEHKSEGSETEFKRGYKLEYTPKEYCALDWMNKEPEEEKYPDWMMKTKEVIDKHRTYEFGTTRLKGRYKEVEIKDDRFPGWELTGRTDSVEIKRKYEFDYFRLNKVFSYMNPFNLFKNNK